jgi:hypothetical protein
MRGHLFAGATLSAEIRPEMARQDASELGKTAQLFTISCNQSAVAWFLGSHWRPSKEIAMLKGVIGLLTVLCVTGAAYAQEAPRTGQTGQAAGQTGQAAGDVRALTDARIGLVKAALQLTPDQAKFWPPIEQAIRERAQGRAHRIAQLKQLAEQAGRHDFDPVTLMRGHAANLTERGDSLKKLADAWQPLYQTLNGEQKERLRLLAMHVVREVREAVRDRRMERMELEDDEAD